MYGFNLKKTKKIVAFTSCWKCKRNREHYIVKKHNFSHQNIEKKYDFYALKN